MRRLSSSADWSAILLRGRIVPNRSALPAAGGGAASRRPRGENDGVTHVQMHAPQSVGAARRGAHRPDVFKVLCETQTLDRSPSDVIPGTWYL
jgi:hypothetical protein